MFQQQQQTPDSIGGLMPQILKTEASDEKGEMARLSSFVGAIAICDLIKTTLGPKGMDKILQPLSAEGAGDKIVITNDGATILKSIYVDNPAAKILVDISKTQDSTVGDGTTTVAVLAGELLREAEKLIHRKFHPQVIIEGWREARKVARETLLKIASDNSKDREQFRKDLINIAKTTLSSKLLTHEKEFFAKMVVDAVLRFHEIMPNLEYIHIIKKPGGSLRDSFLADGFILEKSISVACPKVKKNPRILVANTQMDYDKIKIYGSKVKVDSIDKMAEIESAEKLKMKNKVDKILAHNIDVFINRQLIYNYPEQLMAEKGIMVIEHADFEGVERLASVLGADILSTFDNPEKAKLGSCELVEEIMIGEDKMISFKGAKRGEACTIVLRGASNHILDEAERSLHDALCVVVETVKSRLTVYGGGHTEMRMAFEVDRASENVKGKASVCMNSFAHALRQLPTIIADNAGFDSAELVANLKNEIFNGKPAAGLDMNQGVVGDMKELGIYECYRVKEQALLSACEAAEMILRVDEVVTCAPRKRDRE